MKVTSDSVSLCMEVTANSAVICMKGATVFRRDYLVDFFHRINRLSLPLTIIMACKYLAIITLLFKKLCLFASSIKVLEINYIVSEYIYILKERVIKIAR